MSNIWRSSICLLALFFCAGCVSQSTYEEKQNELASLQGLYVRLQEENTQLRSEIDDLQQQLDYYLNGPSKLLADMKSHYEAGAYTEAVTVAQTLHNEFNGMPEDVEAQSLVAQIEALQQQQEAEKALAEEAARVEAQKSAKEKADEIIKINKVTCSSPNSAGGVDLFIGYTNRSDNVIKYAYFDVRPYNSVGDAVNCEIRRYSLFSAQDEGPYKKGEGLAGNYNWYWQNAWYNSTIKSVVLEKVSIEYMDGSKAEISGKDFEYKW